jgi:hypothetical protein
VRASVLAGTASPVASARRRLSALAETVAGVCVSAACYGSTKYIGIIAFVVTELEFRNVQRHILFAHLVERADDATLEDGPEAFKRVGVYGSNDVLAFS